MFFILIFTSIISSYTPNLFILWILLEISSMTFSIMLNYNKFKIFSIMYFLISSMTSMLIIFSFLNNINNNYLLMFSMWLKLGLFPLNNWMNFMMNKINYLMLMPLMTIMKFIPIIIFFNFIKFNNYLIILIILISLPPVILAMNTSSYPLLLNYSSMYNIPLILILSFMNSYLLTNYVIIYMLSTLMIMLLLKYSNSYYKNSLNLNLDWKNKFFYNIMMIMYVQLPPFSTFMLKWNLIESILMKPNFMLLSMFIMISSLIMTFNYLNFNNSTYFLTNYKIGHKIIYYKNNKMMLIIPMLSFSIIYLYLYMN
uniref:NADH-ubiquinone oxidoreductase chain 2 n=1 Tax=Sphecodes ephippius TaxID=1126396 RepID=A0A0S2LSU7_9HYME|nr:NADH dehydrogenase subunit 2 [Sphecodes ephippius]